MEKAIDKIEIVEWRKRKSRFGFALFSFFIISGYGSFPLKDSILTLPATVFHMVSEKGGFENGTETDYE